MDIEKSKWRPFVGLPFDLKRKCDVITWILQIKTVEEKMKFYKIKNILVNLMFVRTVECQDEMDSFYILFTFSDESMISIHYEFSEDRDYEFYCFNRLKNALFNMDTADQDN